MIENTDPVNNNKSFVRWQQKTLNERSNTVNLFLGMSFASVGFVITQPTKPDFYFKNCYDKFFIGIVSLVVLMAICLLVLMVLNRLRGFRITTQVARKAANGQIENFKIFRGRSDKIDKRTHSLFNTSLCIFVVGEIFIVVGFIIQTFNKF